jgi:hypothetical protein
LIIKNEVLKKRKGGPDPEPDPDTQQIIRDPESPKVLDPSRSGKLQNPLQKLILTPGIMRIQNK